MAGNITPDRVMRLASAVLVLCSCASWIDDKAASSTYRILEVSIEAAPRQADLELARDAMPGAIMQLEAFALAYPKHHGFKVLHANALCQYAVAFVFDDWEDATLTGRTADAERLAQRLRGMLASCVDAQRALLPREWSPRDLPALTQKDADIVLWLATAGVVEIALDPLRAVGQLATVRAELTRCAEVAPGARDADAEILLGTLQAGLSSMVGGDDGHDHFARAKRRVGEGVLNVDVMFARGVAVARKDRALFTTTLQRVLDADVSRWPEHRLANEIARRKAQRYRSAIDRLIPM